MTLTVCVAVTIYSGHGRVVMLPAGMRQNDTGHISLCGVQNKRMRKGFIIKHRKIRKKNDSSQSVKTARRT